MFQLSLRTNPENPNHHLWNNNGTWFIHYVVHPTPITKERIRKSLGTKSLTEARAKRDAIERNAMLRDEAAVQPQRRYGKEGSRSQYTHGAFAPSLLLRRNVRT